MLYLYLKYIHILSSTLLFGTGLGSAFYYWRAHQQNDLRARYFAVRNVVIADWLFTLPAVVIQPITGVLLMHVLSVPFSAHWIMLTLVLYAIAGACWIPVVWLQIQMEKCLKDAIATGKSDCPDYYYFYYRCWFFLGWPAFTAVIIIFYLMVIKPWGMY